MSPYAVSARWVQSNGGVVCSDATGTLLVNGIEFNHPPAWCAPDLTPLWGSADRIGIATVDQADAHGAWPYPQWDGATERTLAFSLSGHFDRDGAEAAEPWAQLWDHVNYLNRNLFDMRLYSGPSDDIGEPVDAWEASLVLPDGLERVGTVKVSNLQLGAHARAAYRCSFDLLVVTGSFRLEPGS